MGGVVRCGVVLIDSHSGKLDLNGSKIVRKGVFEKILGIILDVMAYASFN
jgi:hypothetical protein